jgi:polyisoprenyl-teichoic acid--peptidoglycan teichoic acid transferase
MSGPVSRRATARTAVGTLVTVALAATLATGCSSGGADRPQSPTSASGQSGPAVTIGRNNQASAAPEYDRRLVFLVIGSDAGAPRFGRGGSADRGLADSIHLVVVDGTRKRGMVIGIPRDSYVPIPGHGTRKINAAMSMGGPALLIRTVERLAGMQIDYYALTSFDGLIDLVNGVGGVTVDVDRRVVDKVAGANLQPGRKRLSGDAALAYSRARKSLPNGDFGRSEHQGDVLVGGLRTFQEQSLEDPAAVMRWLSVATREVKTDLPFQDLFRLALFSRQFQPGSLRNVVLSGRPATAGGASVVRLDSGASRILADARAGRF